MDSLTDRDALVEWYLKYGERSIECRRLGDIDTRFVILFYHDWLEDTAARDFSKHVLKIAPRGLEFIKNG